MKTDMNVSTNAFYIPGGSRREKERERANSNFQLREQMTNTYFDCIRHLNEMQLLRCPPDPLQNLEMNSHA